MWVAEEAIRLNKGGAAGIRPVHPAGTSSKLPRPPNAEGRSTIICGIPFSRMWDGSRCADHLDGKIDSGSCLRSRGNGRWGDAPAAELTLPIPFACDSNHQTKRGTEVKPGRPGPAQARIPQERSSGERCASPTPREFCFRGRIPGELRQIRTVPKPRKSKLRLTWPPCVCALTAIREAD